MNHFNKFKQYLAIQTFLAIILPGAFSVIAFVLLREQLDLNLALAIVGSVAVLIISTGLAHYGLLKTSIQPLQMIWQAVWHVSPQRSDLPAPNIESIRWGRELVSAVVQQVYELASSSSSIDQGSSQVANPVQSDQLLESLPLAVLVLNKDWQVIKLNGAACSYIEKEREDTVGKNINEVLHMSFTTEDTFDNWLNTSAENRATATQTWDHVKLNIDGKKAKSFDLAASYSKDHSAGYEVVLILFEKSKAYTVQEQATSYVALAVHELRTPLTMLRGYIELFEDELGEQLSPDHKEFMRKMSASAQSLTAFVNNILNVARIDEDQLTLTLHEVSWPDTLKEIIESLELRAQVKGKRLQLDIASDLPSVGIDKISMHEVMNNLVDNAIKYSGQSPDIIITAKLNSEGYVETSVQDFGTGIPQNVIGKLFSKYYRAHRSKSAVSGSGLGLYLVKSIITAHGGNVWVRSKENEGSTFGFNLLPYDKLNKSDRQTGKDGIERQASGWIKNHSLYRR